MHLKLLFSGFLFAAGTALALTAHQRLTPESSPVARGAAHAAAHPCKDSSCQAELQGLSHQCDELSDHTACTDVSAYWRAVGLNRQLDARLKQAPHNPLLQGERLARERHCFRCHGELGQGGMANTGALKGYIPGYFGRDFRRLTDGRRRVTVREWITTGSSRSLTEHPMTGFIASFFLKRQAVSMPSFASIPTAELDLLTDYVITLNLLGSLDIEGVERYAAYTRLPRSDPELESLLLAARKLSVPEKSVSPCLLANASHFPINPVTISPRF